MTETPHFLSGSSLLIQFYTYQVFWCRYGSGMGIIFSSTNPTRHPRGDQMLAKTIFLIGMDGETHSLRVVGCLLGAPADFRSIRSSMCRAARPREQGFSN